MLAFRKSIKDKVGGYYFHGQIPWVEDSEFNYRIQQAGLKVDYDPKAVAYHAPLSLKQDIRRGFRYGRGKRIAKELNLLPQISYFQLATQAKKFIKTFEVFKEKGLLPALYYLFIWRLSNRIGYIAQGFTGRLAR